MLVTFSCPTLLFLNTGFFNFKNLDVFAWVPFSCFYLTTLLNTCNMHGNGICNSVWILVQGPLTVFSNKKIMLQIIHDLNCLVEEVCGDYLGHVLGLLKSCPREVLDLVKQSILQGGDSLKVLQPLVINSIVETLVDKSVEVSNFSNFVFTILLQWKVLSKIYICK